MQRLKVLLVVTLVLSMLLGLGISANAASGIKIMFDGTQLVSDQAPVLQNGNTLVPIRVITEAMGAEVTYASGKVTITTADHNVVLTINSKTAVVDGNNVSMDVPAKIIGGRTFIPLRAVSTMMGIANSDITYDSATQTVSIKYFTTITTSLKLSGSTTVYPIATACADALMKMNSGISITVAEGGSGAGVKDAGTGTVNIGNISTELSSSDLTTYPDLIQTRVGNDAVAIIVNSKNTIKNLTKQQVFDIFTGKTTNWKDVGGSDAAIFVETREATSGTLDCLKKTALAKIDKTAVVTPNATPYNSTGLLLQAVKDNENAIGFVSMGYIDGTVNAVNIEDIQCTYNNGFYGIWPYTRHLNMVTKGKPSGDAAKFINFVRSPQGQKILMDQKYLPLFDKYLPK